MNGLRRITFHSCVKPAEMTKIEMGGRSTLTSWTTFVGFFSFLFSVCHQKYTLINYQCQCHSLASTLKAFVQGFFFQATNCEPILQCNYLIFMMSAKTKTLAFCSIEVWIKSTVKVPLMVIWTHVSFLPCVNWFQERLRVAYGKKLCQRWQFQVPALAGNCD